MLRIALRRLLHDRGFTIAAVLALGLGIGGANTVFTLLNGIVLRGLPTHDPERIVAVRVNDTTRQDAPAPYDDYVEWTRSSRGFESLTANAVRNVSLAEAGRVSERFIGTYVSAGTFEMLGERPIAGRTFTPQDDERGAEVVVVLGYAAWRNRYDGDPSVVGRQVRVNGTPATIIGIMRQGFRFPTAPDLWLPLASMPELAASSNRPVLVDVVGRLAEGTTAPQAEAEITALLQRRVAATSSIDERVRASVVPFTLEYIGSPVQVILSVLLGAAILLILIGCINVANLLLARGAAREREVAIRTALGGTRRALLTQFLTEHLLLALAAGVLGLLLSMAGARAFDAFTSRFVDRPYWFDFSLDARILAFLALISISTVLVFGLVPAFRASRVSTSSLHAQAGSNNPRQVWTDLLVVVELALTLTVLSGAALMTRAVLGMLTPGFETGRLATLRFELPAARYATSEARAAFADRLESALEATPLVSASAVTSALPMWGARTYELSLDGRSAADTRPVLVDGITVGPRYFETVDVTLLRGRAFRRGDGTPGTRAAIVNEAFAAAHFPNVDALGHRVRLTLPDGRADSGWATIVGIAPMLRQRSFGDPRPMVYLPFEAMPEFGAGIIMRVDGEPSTALATALATARETARTLEPDVTVYDALTMDASLGRVNFVGPVFGSIFGVFASIALALCTIGLYAVTAYGVSRRTREIGVRVALGATTPRVWWLVLRRGALLVIVGLPLGLAGAIAISRVLQSALATSAAGDPRVIASASVMLIAVMLAACGVPARRAARLDPSVALRVE